MIRIVLIGSGNVAHHLCSALANCDRAKLLEVRARRPEALSGFDPAVHRTGLKAPMPETDLVLLAVSDDAVSTLSRELDPGDHLTAHCSGALPCSAIKGSRRMGVFYPLQTFSKSRPMEFSGIPVLLEAPLAEDLQMLRELTAALGGIPHAADASARLRLHLAAVFANNFTNHLVHIAGELVREAGLDAALLRPLIRETAAKLEDLPAREAQTGPARRGDEITVDRHLELLGDTPSRTLYELLTKSIRNTYETEL